MLSFRKLQYYCSMILIFISNLRFLSIHDLYYRHYGTDTILFKQELNMFFLHSLRSNLSLISQVSWLPSKHCTTHSAELNQ